MKHLFAVLCLSILTGCTKGDMDYLISLESVEKHITGRWLVESNPDGTDADVAFYYFSNPYDYPPRVHNYTQSVTFEYSRDCIFTIGIEYVANENDAATSYSIYPINNITEYKGAFYINDEAYRIHTLTDKMLILMINRSGITYILYKDDRYRAANMQCQ